MIGRQWQVGELRGDDAARPAAVRVTVGTAAVDRWRPTASATMRPLPPGVPTERLVESMPVPASGAAATFSAAQRGAGLLRRLRHAGLDLAADRLIGEFSFAVEPEGGALGPTDVLAARVLARRGMDGTAVAAATAVRLTTALDGLSAAEQAATIAVIDDWRGAAAPALDSWVDERMEYRFAVGATTDLGPVTLTADGHDGGELDWYAFDIATDRPRRPDRPDQPGQVTLAETTVSAVPTNVRFAGMPASRWWEFEDGSVHFGDLDAGPSDLARLAVADFVTAYADDWFLAPVRLPTGTLSRVLRLEVYDTMGRRTTVDPASSVDRARTPDRPRAFRLFELSGDAPGGTDRPPWLYLPAALASTLNGDPLERVELARDEGANLCWAVERLVEGPLGRAVDRARAWLASRPAGAPRTDTGDEQWEYRVESPTPPWWIPLLPQRDAASAQMRLRRSRMRSWSDLPPAQAGAKGTLLRPGRPLWIREEEVPAAGVTVDRRWQLARWHDGTVHLWLQHRKRPGRGERSSGIVWDRIDR
ncbi:hypothetical protein AB0J27_11115 [Micromonospora chokoriensis]